MLKYSKLCKSGPSPMNYPTNHAHIIVRQRQKMEKPISDAAHVILTTCRSGFSKACINEPRRERGRERDRQFYQFIAEEEEKCDKKTPSKFFFLVRSASSAFRAGQSHPNPIFTFPILSICFLYFCIDLSSSQL